MTVHIKIIGSGLSGLLIAYHLHKLIPKDSHAVQIEVFDSQTQSADIATTISLGWLNTAYPCSSSYEKSAVHYDQYRLASLNAWPELNNMLNKDGIINIIDSEKEIVKINSELLTSMYVFFDTKEQHEFLEMVNRLDTISKNYKAQSISHQKIEPHFPFLANLPPYFLHNIASEALVNPNQLRAQLINHLQQRDVVFHWETAVTAKQIQSESATHWILAAGNGCADLVKNTRLDGMQFVKDSVAEVIYCTLSSPLDLRGKVFHFAPTESTAGFHLRNNEADLSQVKIIIDYDSRKEGNLKDNAQAIFNLLHLPVVSFQCINTIRRPMTPDGKPVIEMNLGEHRNIHLVYGHNLYSLAGRLYGTFSQNVAAAINQQQAVFIPVTYQPELEPFSSMGRQFKSVLRNKCMFAKPDQQTPQPFVPRMMQSNETNGFRAKL